MSITALSLIVVFVAGLIAYLRPAKRLSLISSEAENKSRSKPIKRCLLVTAHPDDECMFFSPAILHLNSLNVKVYIFCLSRGNYDGLGDTREKELFKSAAVLGIPENRVQVLEDP
jgi:N-acetylglucosaminylphosphatidylinositol deacetylase